MLSLSAALRYPTDITPESVTLERATSEAEQLDTAIEGSSYRALQLCAQRRRTVARRCTRSQSRTNPPQGRTEAQKKCQLTRELAYSQCGVILSSLMVSEGGVTRMGMSASGISALARPASCPFCSAYVRAHSTLWIQRSRRQVSAPAGLRHSACPPLAAYAHAAG